MGQAGLSDAREAEVALGFPLQVIALQIPVAAADEETPRLELALGGWGEN